MSKSALEIIELMAYSQYKILENQFDYVGYSLGILYPGSSELNMLK
jgi:hypothetical protein